MVVVVVDAVRGRSPPPDGAANLPRFCIRYLSSSKLVQTVDGAVVETMDSLSSAWCDCSLLLLPKFDSGTPEAARPLVE